MAIGLHNLSPRPGSQKKKMRVGRGLSKKGVTAGRGQKGQKSRSGVSNLKRLGMRKLILATPKLRGFTSPHKKFSIVKLQDIETKYAHGGLVTPRSLKEHGLIRTIQNGVKILGNGDVTVKLKVSGCHVTKAASEKILKAGGEIAA